MIKLKRLLMKRGLKLVAAVFLTLLTAITLTTCGGGGGSGDGGGGGGSSNGGGGGGGGSSTSNVIGPSGGSITLKDTTVNIPANLLSQDAKVTLTEVSPSSLQIDNSFILGTLVQITMEPVATSSTSALRDVQIKSFWGDIKQSMSIYWNNIDEAKAAISAGICMSTKVVTPAVGSVGQKILSIPCKISNSTAVATEVLFLQWANTSAQKFIGTYGLISNQIRELNTQPSLKSLTLTDSNQQGESRELDNSPLNGRTPIILIHGINRDENLGRDCPLNNSEKERFWCYNYKRDVWNTFYEEAAKIAGFYSKFKVYEYVYPSYKDMLDTGPPLSSLIQNDPELANSKIFLVAHSYGGLIARQAMKENNGALGNQTINLFTLATPHHGSIGASLLNLMPGTLNDPVANAFLLDTKTLIAINFGKVYYGLAVGTQGYQALRWDNFDGGIPQHYTDNLNVFTNSLLKTFNEGRDNFKGRIITYSGGNLGVLDPTVVNDILNSSDISDALGKIPNTISLNRVLLWFASEVVERFGDYNDTNALPNYPDSDGMVERGSANFEGGSTLNELVLDDVDHEQIFDDLRVINNIQNKMWSTYTISGAVTSNGVGLAGVTISWSVTNGSDGGGGSIITDSNGNYQLGIQNGYTYTITPSMTGYTFTPTNRTGTANSAGITGQDFVGTAVTSAVTWAKTYSTNSSFFSGIAIKQTNDGSYITVGGAVTKLNVNGDILWQKNYFTGGTYIAVNDIQQTSDGGYIGVGYNDVYGNFVFLIKLYANGDVNWVKRYGVYVQNVYQSFQQTSDGGYIIAGRTYLGFNDYRMWVLKVDVDGNIQWEKTYDNWNNLARVSIQPTSDGKYIIAGGYSNVSAILKLDTDGTILWEKRYSNLVLASGSIKQTIDGGYILVGGGIASSLYVIKLDNSGDIVWQKFLYGIISGGGSIQQTTDGGYIVAGWVMTDNKYEEILVLKLDSSGNIQWQKTYGDSGSDIYPSSIQQTSDGNYILAGLKCSSRGSGCFDIWVLKIDSNGNIGSSCNIIGILNNFTWENSNVTVSTYSGIVSTLTTTTVVSPSVAVTDTNATTTTQCSSQ
ncbi:MAG: hypothetical protein WA240_12765 [Nitrospirota bacterium]